MEEKGYAENYAENIFYVVSCFDDGFSLFARCMEFDLAQQELAFDVRL